MIKAIYPGSFDPITLGHGDIIRRAAALFDCVVIGVGRNPAKSEAFPLKERLAMVRRDIAALSNVEVLPFEGLVIDFAKKVRASVILRGVRGVADLDIELQMAATNRACGGIETLFMAPSPEFAHINARFVREIAARGGDVRPLVTPAVAAKLRSRFRS